MKISPLRTIVFAVLTLLAMAGFSHLRADQFHMDEAIEHLEKAKHADHPIEHLEKAKHQLEEAEHNKHGDRREAIHQVNEAIEAARKDEHKRMEEHINIAIHEVREGKR